MSTSLVSRCRRSTSIPKYYRQRFLASIPKHHLTLLANLHLKKSRYLFQSLSDLLRWVSKKRRRFQKPRSKSGGSSKSISSNSGSIKTKKKKSGTWIRIKTLSFFFPSKKSEPEPELLHQRPFPSIRVIQDNHSIKKLPCAVRDLNINRITSTSDETTDPTSTVSNEVEVGTRDADDSEVKKAEGDNELSEIEVKKAIEDSASSEVKSAEDSGLADKSKHLEETRLKLESSRGLSFGRGGAGASSRAFSSESKQSQPSQHRPRFPPRGQSLPSYPAPRSIAAILHPFLPVPTSDSASVSKKGGQDQKDDGSLPGDGDVNNNKKPRPLITPLSSTWPSRTSSRAPSVSSIESVKKERPKSLVNPPVTTTIRKRSSTSSSTFSPPPEENDNADPGKPELRYGHSYRDHARTPNNHQHRRRRHQTHYSSRHGHAPKVCHHRRHQSHPPPVIVPDPHRRRYQDLLAYAINPLGEEGEDEEEQVDGASTDSASLVETPAPPSSFGQFTMKLSRPPSLSISEKAGVPKLGESSDVFPAASNNQVLSSEPENQNANEKRNSILQNGSDSKGALDEESDSAAKNDTDANLDHHTYAKAGGSLAVDGRDSDSASASGEEGAVVLRGERWSTNMNKGLSRISTPALERTIESDGESDMVERLADDGSDVEVILGDIEVNRGGIKDEKKEEDVDSEELHSDAPSASTAPSTYSTFDPVMETAGAETIKKAGLGDGVALEEVLTESCLELDEEKANAQSKARNAVSSSSSLLPPGAFRPTRRQQPLSVLGLRARTATNMNTTGSTAIAPETTSSHLDSMTITEGSLSNIYNNSYLKEELDGNCSTRAMAGTPSSSARFSKGESKPDSGLPMHLKDLPDKNKNNWSRFSSSLGWKEKNHGNDIDDDKNDNTNDDDFNKFSLAQVFFTFINFVLALFGKVTTKFAAGIDNITPYPIFNTTHQKKDGGGKVDYDGGVSGGDDDEMAVVINGMKGGRVEMITRWVAVGNQGFGRIRKSGFGGDINKWKRRGSMRRGSMMSGDVGGDLGIEYKVMKLLDIPQDTALYTDIICVPDPTLTSPQSQDPLSGMDSIQSASIETFLSSGSRVVILPSSLSSQNQGSLLVSEPSSEQKFEYDIRTLNFWIATVIKDLRKRDMQDSSSPPPLNRDTGSMDQQGPLQRPKLWRSATKGGSLPKPESLFNSFKNGRRRSKTVPVTPTDEFPTLSHPQHHTQTPWKSSLRRRAMSDSHPSLAALNNPSSTVGNNNNNSTSHHHHRPLNDNKIQSRATFLFGIGFGGLVALTYSLCNSPLGLISLDQPDLGYGGGDSGERDGGERKRGRMGSLSECENGISDYAGPGTRSKAPLSWTHCWGGSGTGRRDVSIVQDNDSSFDPRVSISAAPVLFPTISGILAISPLLESDRMRVKRKKGVLGKAREWLADLRNTQPKNVNEPKNIYDLSIDPALKKDIEALDIQAQRLKIPLFIQHGTLDPFTSASRIKNFYNSFSSPDKTLFFISGMRHLLLSPATATIRFPDTIQCSLACQSLYWIKDRSLSEEQATTRDERNGVSGTRVRFVKGGIDFQPYWRLARSEVRNPMQQNPLYDDLTFEDIQSASMIALRSSNQDSKISIDSTTGSRSDGASGSVTSIISRFSLAHSDSIYTETPFNYRRIRRLPSNIKNVSVYRGKKRDSVVTNSTSRRIVRSTSAPTRMMEGGDAEDEGEVIKFRSSDDGGRPEMTIEYPDQRRNGEEGDRPDLGQRSNGGEGGSAMGISSSSPVSPTLFVFPPVSSLHHKNLTSEDGSVPMEPAKKSLEDSSSLTTPPTPPKIYLDTKDGTAETRRLLITPFPNGASSLLKRSSRRMKEVKRNLSLSKQGSITGVNHHRGHSDPWTRPFSPTPYSHRPPIHRHTIATNHGVSPEVMVLDDFPPQYLVPNSGDLGFEKLVGRASFIPFPVSSLQIEIDLSGRLGLDGLLGSVGEGRMKRFDGKDEMGMKLKERIITDREEKGKDVDVDVNVEDESDEERVGRMV